MPGALSGGWGGLALAEHAEPGNFRDPNYFSGTTLAPRPSPTRGLFSLSRVLPVRILTDANVGAIGPSGHSRH